MIIFIHKAHRTLLRYLEPNIGRLISPSHFGRIADTAELGIFWAADNDCYQGLDESAYRRMLDRIYGLRGCKFVVAPDVVADWETTRALYEDWYNDLIALLLPLAYVAQDGQPIEHVPWRRIDALFIGGTSIFKCSDEAHDLVIEARRRGLWVHMGRVNTEQRMRLAKSWGCDSIDGSSVSMFTDTRLPERLVQARAEQQLNLREVL